MAPGLFGLLGTVARDARAVARAIPVLRTVEAQAGQVERVLLGEFKRLFEDPRDKPLALAGGDAVPAAPPPQPLTPAETLQALLRQSMANTPDESRRALHATLLAEIVPDEARLLSALSDGSAYPLIHIAEPGIGTYQKRVLENASSIGRAAGVALPERTHVYVSHLRRLNLVETGPEDTALRDEYELLLTDSTVRRAMAGFSKGPRGARVIRRTLRISELGRELWEAAT